MKEKRLKIANELQKSIDTKRSNMKDATAFIAAMEGRKEIIVKSAAGGYDTTYFRLPSRLAKYVLAGCLNCIRYFFITA